jgi:predicted ester cyclase
MSLDENKDLVRRLIEDVFNAGRTDLVAEFFKPGSMLAGSFAENLKYEHSVFPDIHRSVEALVAEDDQVVAVLSTHGTNTGPFPGGQPPTGKAASWGSMQLYKIKDGRIISAIFCSDQLGIRRQLGLVPEDLP